MQRAKKEKHEMVRLFKKKICGLKVERFLLQIRIMSKMEQCPECDGKMYDDGEEVACKVCGYVVEKNSTK